VLSGWELEVQRHPSSCLTLIMACIIYWQAMEINRILLEDDPEGAGVVLSLLEHISPIGLENIILYGNMCLIVSWLGYSPSDRASLAYIYARKWDTLCQEVPPANLMSRNVLFLLKDELSFT
jgi:hypothetical protein